MAGLVFRPGFPCGFLGAGGRLHGGYIESVGTVLRLCGAMARRTTRECSHPPEMGAGYYNCSIAIVVAPFARPSRPWRWTSVEGGSHRTPAVTSASSSARRAVRAIVCCVARNAKGVPRVAKSTAQGAGSARGSESASAGTDGGNAQRAHPLRAPTEAAFAAYREIRGPLVAAAACESKSGGRCTQLCLCLSLKRAPPRPVGRSPSHHFVYFDGI